MARTLSTTSARAAAMMPSAAFGRRFATTVVAIPVLAWVIMGAPSWLFPLVIVLVAAAATHEVTALFDRAGHATLGSLAVVLGALVTASFAFQGATVLALVLAAMVAVASPLWRRGALSIEPAATALLAFVYVNCMLGHAVWLYVLPRGPWLVLLLLGTTWVGETAAYLVGSSVGRHKLAPVISPNKTLEGAAAQVVASVAASVALGMWLLPETSALFCAGAGALVGVVGQVGDLAESAIKRAAKAKDAGGLIPGHGGMLDRVDGLLFNVPAFFYYVVLIGGRA